MTNKYSNKDQLEALETIIYQCLRAPVSDNNNIPGYFLESALANVRGGVRLNCYGFIDVVSKQDRTGWQVKSTKASSPLTWKRVKLSNQTQRIDESNMFDVGPQQLGDSVIDYCNEHTAAGIKEHDIDEVYYSRLLMTDGSIKYMERKLCDNVSPNIFNKADYTWTWSESTKNIGKKERLPALNGHHVSTGEKMWSWYGLGENQLHFAGEHIWWNDPNSLIVDFKIPHVDDKIPLSEYITLLMTYTVI